MRKVVFIRHAKSSWEHPELADYDRPVANRGIRDIETVGSYLFKAQVIPDSVLSSGALRTLTTAKGICSKINFKDLIEIKKDLYFGGVSKLLNLVRAAKDEHECLFIFFHNPDINNVAIGQMKLSVNNIPTLGCVFTECDERRWKDWAFEKAVVRRYTSPKLIKKGLDFRM